MRIAKYIFLLILLFSIAFIVFIATQPSDFDVKSEKTIAISKTKLFQFVDDYKNWEFWYPSLKNSPTIKTSLSETSFGEGAFLKWDHETISTSQQFEKDSIYQLKKVDDQEYTTYWIFKEEKEGTKVVWGIKGKMNFTDKLNAFLNGGTQSELITSIELGLENINDYLVNEVSNFNILVNGIVTRPASFYIQQKDSCKVGDFNLRAVALIQKINTFVNQNDIQAIGDSFIQVLDTNSNGYINFRASVPIEEEILTTPLSDIKGNYLEEYTALKTTLKGDYSHLKETVSKATKYIEKSDEYIIDESIPFMEVYKSIGDIKQVKTSEKITELLIPVKSKNSKPVTTPKPVIVTKPMSIAKKDTVK